MKNGSKMAQGVIRGISVAARGLEAVGRLQCAAATRILRSVGGKSTLRRSDASTLLRIVRPEAQGRWLLPSLAVMTPQYVEAILRGALQGNQAQQWELFDLMEDTWPRLAKNLKELKRAACQELMGSDWQVRAWSEKGAAASAGAEEKAALYEEALFGMRPAADGDEDGFESACDDLLDAWGKGTSLLEMEWEEREMGLVPRAMFWVHPRNYGWGEDGRLGLHAEGLEGVERGSVGAYGYGAGARDLVPLVPDKFLVGVSKGRTGHPCGAALLRPLAWWWCASNFAADWLLNFAQVFGLPIRWANYAPEASDATISAINAMLENMGSSGWGSFPAGTTLELKEAGKAGDSLPQGNILDRADKQCDLLVLGQTLTTDVGSQGRGSRALGEVHADVRGDVIHAAASFVARVFNEQLAPALLRLNYGEESERPSLVRSEEDIEDAKVAAELIEIAVQTGVPVPVAWALERLNIPKAEEGEELVKAPVAAAGPGVERGSVEGESVGSVGASERGSVERRRAIMAKNVQEKLVENVLEELTGVEARWLGGVKPVFRRLVAAALSERVSDKDFIEALERAQGEMPELFGKLGHGEVQEALEGAMGASCVNGAVRGAMGRGA